MNLHTTLPEKKFRKNIETSVCCWKNFVKTLKSSIIYSFFARNFVKTYLRSGWNLLKTFYWFLSLRFVCFAFCRKNSWNCLFVPLIIRFIILATISWNNRIHRIFCTPYVPIKNFVKMILLFIMNDYFHSLRHSAFDVKIFVPQFFQKKKKMVETKNRICHTFYFRGYFERWR